jgi:hypothetical protein
MSETLLRAIDAMSAPDAEARVAAANEIHRIGRALADHAVFPWWSDQELSALLDGGNPFVTIGLAVSPERFQKIREASGLPRLADVPPDQDAQEFELHLPGGICRNSAKEFSRSSCAARTLTVPPRFSAKGSRLAPSIPQPARAPMALSPISS